MTEDEYILLVYKNLKGEISSQEFELLNKTTAGNSLLASTRVEIEDAWDVSGTEKTLVSDSDTKALFEKIVTENKNKPTNSKGKNQSEAKVFPIGRILSAIAAVLIAVLGAVFLFQNNTTTYDKAGVYTLADNSIVTLRAGSSLKVDKFDDSQRRVSLNGEAYFDVAKDSNRPFIISGNHVKIQVLGTSFLVKELDDETYIELTEGKISTLDTRSLDSKTLTTGMKAHHTSEGKINLISEYNNLSAWREGFYQYRNTNLGKVIEELSIIFETNISLSDARLADCSFSGNISGQKIEEVLAPIRKKFKMNILQEESKWILSDGTCN